MTKEMFFEYSTHFIEYIRIKRKDNYFTPDEPILLILDGHISRANVAALVVLRNENIHVLTLPSHLTHILQPYGVGIAQSLRSSFRKILWKIYKSKKLETNNQISFNVSTKRNLMIESLIDAFHQGRIISNCVGHSMPQGSFHIHLKG